MYCDQPHTLHQLYSTSSVFTSTVHPPCSHQLYILHVHINCISSVFTSIVHLPCSHELYILRVHINCTSSVFTSAVHPPCSHQLYILHVHINCTSSVFTSTAHPPNSHQLYILRVHINCVFSVFTFLTINLSYVRHLLLWDVKQRSLVVVYRRFGTAYLKRSSSPPWTTKLLRNIGKQPQPQPHAV